MLKLREDVANLIRHVFGHSLVEGTTFKGYKRQWHLPTQLLRKLRTDATN